MDKKSRYIYLLRRFEQRVAAMLLLLFVGYYTNVALFTHTHIIDGVTIVHSHLHSQGHTEQSGDDAHSETELTLIASISNYVALEQDHITPLTIEWVNFTPIFADVAEPLSIAPSCTLPQLRAPPVEISIG